MLQKYNHEYKSKEEVNSDIHRHKHIHCGMETVIHPGYYPINVVNVW